MNAVFDMGASATKWMNEDLAKSGVTSDDIGSTAVQGIGATPWPNVVMKDKSEVNMSVYVSSYYTIPYWKPSGEPLAEVVIRKPRFKPETPHEVKEKKYARPPAKLVGSMASVPYMHPARLENAVPVLDIHEGEKKTACAAVHGQCAIGVAGCWSWGDPENKGRVHPWIAEEVARIQKAFPEDRVKVRMWADADYKTNPSVSQGYSGLAAELTALDVDVFIMDMSVFGERAKFDDLVAMWDYKRVMTGSVEQPASTLPENPESLARRFQLLTQPVGKDPVRQLPQSIATNLNKLLERHPRFQGKLWLDRDRQKSMFGDEELVENIGDHRVLHFFQENLGFNGNRSVSLQGIRDALSHRLALDQRSPFNDRVLAAAERLREAGPDAVRTANDDLNAWAVRYLRAPNTPWDRLWGRKFLMAVAGRALRPGCPMRTAFCLAGPQGIGKTHFMNSIVGESNVTVFKEDNAQGKDLAMGYAKCLVAVHDEMAAMGSRGIEHVKSDISTAVDMIRLPYGRTVQELPRRCVFYIPVDKPDFLFQDSAGMTRFAVLNLLDVPFAAGQGFDFAGMRAAADDLLGAAWIAVETGERFDEVEGAAESALNHVKADLNMDQIVDVIEGERGPALLLTGEYKGRKIVGMKLAALAEAMPHGYKAAGGGSTVLTAPLRKLGFQQEDRNKNPLNVRGLWFMDREKFDAEFRVDWKKFDVPR
jgi:hypothetical protein